MKKKILFLWGFMASGKSKLGKRLAKHYHIPVIDLDHYIIKQERKTIPELFALYGEEQFRKIETLCLKELISIHQHLIISCGGGTPCYNYNHKLMNANGVTVFLEVEKDILIERLWQGRNNRPLISKFETIEDLELFTSKLYENRKPFYFSADLIIDNTYPRDTLEKTIELLTRKRLFV